LKSVHSIEICIQYSTLEKQQHNIHVYKQINTAGFQSVFSWKEVAIGSWKSDRWKEI